MKCPMETRGSEGGLLDYATGELDAAQHARLADHVQACPACSAFVCQQQTVWRALEEWDAEPVSADFDSRLYQRIGQQSRWPQFLRRLDPLFRQAVPLAAAALLLIAAGLLIERPAARPWNPPVKLARAAEAMPPDQLQRALEDMEMLREFNHLVPQDDDAPRM